MKNLYSLLTVSLFLCFHVNAQLYPYIPEDSATIPGSDLTVSETAQQGKHVLIFAFDLGDEIGFDYIQSGDLNQFYSTYGPNGTNEVEVVGMEGNILNSGEYLINYDPVISAGDWFAAADFPIRNNESFSFHYGNVQLPSLIWICPNGSMSEIGLVNLSTLESYLDTQCPEPLASNLAISSALSNEVACSYTDVRVVNLGNTESSEFNCVLNVNGEDVASLGSCCLEAFESWSWNIEEAISLGDIVTVTLEYADDNLSDNVITATIGENLPTRSNHYRVEHMTGIQGQSVWILLDYTENLFAPVLDPFTFYSTEIYVDEGCHSFLFSGEIESNGGFINVIELDENSEPVDTLFKLRPGQYAFEHILDFYASTIYDPVYEVCVFSDDNENGNPDEGEAFISGVEVEYAGQIVFTNDDGCVTLPNATAGDVVSASPDENVFPTITTDNDIELTPSQSNVYIGLSMNDPNYQLDLNLTAQENFSCESASPAYIQVCNQGNQPASGLLVVNVDPLLNVNFANLEGVVNGNEVSWEIPQLGIGDCVSLAFYVDPPSEEDLGEIATYTAELTSLDNEGNVFATENYEADGEILCSYDPNDKQVWPQGLGDSGDIPMSTSSFEYLIRFQNTGNAPANDVLVEDILDDDLDWETLEILSTSHYCEPYINLNTGLVQFSFPGIMLPDSTNNEPESHGAIRYRIAPKQPVEDGMQIENTASIYFDSNPAIVTNTTVNTFNSLINVLEHETQNKLLIYPNPARNTLNIDLRESSGQMMVRIYSIDGRVVHTSNSIGGSIEMLNLEQLEKGLYTIEVSSASDPDLQAVSRFVKE